MLLSVTNYPHGPYYLCWDRRFQPAYTQFPHTERGEGGPAAPEGRGSSQGGCGPAARQAAAGRRERARAEHRHGNGLPQGAREAKRGKRSAGRGHQRRYGPRCPPLSPPSSGAHRPRSALTAAGCSALREGWRSVWEPRGGCSEQEEPRRCVLCGPAASGWVRRCAGRLWEEAALCCVAAGGSCAVRNPPAPHRTASPEVLEQQLLR